MKVIVSISLSLLLAAGVLSAAPNQPGAGGVASLNSLAPGTPRLSPNFATLLGQNSAFTANVDTEIIRGTDNFLSSAKMAFSDGKMRMEVDVNKSKGSGLPPGAVAHWDKRGLSPLVLISLPPKDNLYIIYPALKAYVNVPRTNTTDFTNAKIETTELARETLDGHPCIKNRITINPADGLIEEWVVWNATDLKSFPIKIETGDETAKTKLTFSNVSFDKPDPSLFAPPDDYLKFDDMRTMIQIRIVEQTRGGRALPKY